MKTINLLINRVVNGSKKKEIFNELMITPRSSGQDWLDATFVKQLKELRNSLKETKDSFEFIFKSPVHKKTVKTRNVLASFDGFPTDEEISNLWGEAIEEIKTHREETRSVASVNRHFLNNAINYKMTGNETGGLLGKGTGYTFTKSNSVQGIIGPDFRYNIAQQHKIPDSRIKDNFVGVELEIVSLVDCSKLNKIMADKRLHSYINCGTDSSIRAGDKGGQGVEVRILCKESEVSTIIPKVTAVLQSKEVQAYVNGSCGFHVHLDARTRDSDKMYTNLVRALPLLNSMVPVDRLEGNAAKRYCTQNAKDKFSEGMTEDYGSGSKYKAINPTSFDRQKTIEVRLHSGTINANKIVNWINVLTTIVNHKYVLTNKLTTLTDFANISNDEILMKYMSTRIAKFVKFRDAGKPLDTMGDELTDELMEVVG